MNDFTVCTIKLKSFNIMNLFYPIIVGLAGVLVIGVPLGVVAGIIDTAFVKSGTPVDIAITIFLILWIILAIICFISFFKLVNDIAQTVDALCVGDGKKVMNIWLVLLLNIVTLGIYKFVYFYQLQQRLEKKAPDYNDSVNTSSGNLLLFTILSAIVGLSFLVASGLIIEDVNNLVQLSNENNGYETEQYENWGFGNIRMKFEYLKLR